MPATVSPNQRAVAAFSGADGNVAERRYADGFGNRTSGLAGGGWSYSGHWLADQEGWGHNTKRFHSPANAVYMYQRWYDPRTGTFLSRAPYPAMVEHAYGFAENNPIQFFDPLGTRPSCDKQELIRRYEANYKEALERIEELYNDCMRKAASGEFSFTSWGATTFAAGTAGVAAGGFIGTAVLPGPGTGLGVALGGTVGTLGGLAYYPFAAGRAIKKAQEACKRARDQGLISAEHTHRNALDTLEVLFPD